MALAAHSLVGFSWTFAGILGAALTPPTPRSCSRCSATGRVGGRTGTILEGESGARADGTTIRDLPIGERSWISLVIRDGEPRQARGAHAFEPGDEVLVPTETSDAPAMRRLFETPDAARGALQPAPERRSESLE